MDPGFLTVLFISLTMLIAIHGNLSGYCVCPTDTLRDSLLFPVSGYGRLSFTPALVSES